MTFIDSILINLPGFDILDYISNDEILTSIFPKRVKFFADLIIINKSGYSLNIMNGKYQIMLP